MFKRWHHGHSLVGGAIVGAVVAHDGRLMFALGALLGVTATLAVVYGRRLALTLLGAFEAWRERSRARREPIPVGPQPVYRAAGRRVSPTEDDVPF
jgi:hypothetical protein